MYNSCNNNLDLYYICYRLLSSTDETSDTLDDIIKTTNIHYSDEEEEELNTHLTKDLTFQKHKYKSKLKSHHKDKELYDSSSDIESEEKIDTNKNSSTQHKINSFQANLSKDQFNKSFNSIHPKHGILELREQSIIEKLKDVELQKTSDNDLEAIPTENIETSQQHSNVKKIWLEEHHLLKNNKMVNSFVQDIKKEDYTNEEVKYSKNKVIDTSYDKIYDTFKQNNACEEMKILPNLPEKKEIEDNSKQACEKESLTNQANENNHLAYNLRKDYPKIKIEEIPSIITHDGETLNKSNFNIETKNKLNVSSEIEDMKMNSILSNNVYASQIEQINETKGETTKIKQTDDKKKLINYNKEKLLATMKAIDDNENIEFLNQGFKNHSMMNRMQITENLYRGLPTHSKPKRDIIKDIFDNNHIDNKIRGTCSKSH
jgi:hypothetical protein